MGQSLRRKHDITQTCSPPKKIWDGGVNVSWTSKELATLFCSVSEEIERVLLPMYYKEVHFLASKTKTVFRSLTT